MTLKQAVVAIRATDKPPVRKFISIRAHDTVAAADIARTLITYGIYFTCCGTYFQVRIAFAPLARAAIDMIVGAEHYTMEEFAVWNGKL